MVNQHPVKFCGNKNCGIKNVFNISHDLAGTRELIIIKYYG